MVLQGDMSDANRITSDNQHGYSLLLLAACFGNGLHGVFGMQTG